MDLIHIIVIALIQGITEFLPISSSAHLILIPLVTGWQDQGLVFDVAVHVGTLTAVLAYFRNDLLLMSKDWFGSLLSRQHSVNSRLAWAVIVGTIPVGIIGLLGKPVIETHFRSPFVIAATTIIFGILLGVAYARGRRVRDEHTITWTDTVIIGLAQALALIPGTSRAGITITAGLLRGLTGEAAARFSFLLSIPVTALAGFLEIYDLLKKDVPVDWLSLASGALISGISAYLCIHYFLRLLGRIGMMPFVIYRLLLGIILIVLFV